MGRTVNEDRDSDEARLAAHRRLFSLVPEEYVPPKSAAVVALEDRIFAATLELTAALEYVDRIRMEKECEISYETMQRSRFRRKDGWRRAYTLKDARSNAETAAIRLRNAWEILDPIGKS